MSERGGAAATQPVSPVPTSSYPAVNDPGATWAWLVPSAQNLPPLALTHTTYKVGRENSEDGIVLNADLLEAETTCNRTSRHHFTLSLSKEGTAVLVDHSANGTWVAGKRVGKGQVFCLQHCQDISVVQPEVKVFTILLTDFIHKTFPPDLTRTYLVGEKVGSGSNAEVRLCYRFPKMSRYAVKLVNHSKEEWGSNSKYSKPTDLKMEVKVLEKVDHPCVVKVVDVVETDTLLAIVMEYASGGELFDQVIKDERAKSLQEETAKFQFVQVVDCVRYLHSLNICHRDLKLENLLLARPGARSLIKLTDFGLAKVWGLGGILETYAGTPAYMAPEVLACKKQDASSYSAKSDCWSLGVILFLLLSGRHPFPCNLPDKERDKRLREGARKAMQGVRWSHISEEARDLVEALLEVDPERRLSCEEALAHPWFTNDPSTLQAALKLMKDNQSSQNGHQWRRNPAFKTED